MKSIIKLVKKHSKLLLILLLVIVLVSIAIYFFINKNSFTNVKEKFDNMTYNYKLVLISFNANK